MRRESTTISHNRQPDSANGGGEEEGGERGRVKSEGRQREDKRG